MYNSFSDTYKEDIDYILLSAKTEADQLSGKKILFTGGAGFLGYYFLQSLMEIGSSDGRKPVEIYIIENFIRGRKDWFENFVNKPNVNLIEQYGARAVLRKVLEALEV